MTNFAGFTDDMPRFLAELTLNNNKEWWTDNKQRYEDSVRTPALELITEMGPLLADISPHFLAIPKKSGGSMMRPFRDTRFSKDKTPYKTNLGIQFRHRAGKDVHAPGFYFHVGAADGVFVGVGMWRPDSESLGLVREAIVGRPKEWVEIRDEPGFRATFDLGGESLKRPPRGYDKDHPLVEDLKRKDHIASADLDPDFMLGADLPDRLAERFAAAANYAGFLTEAVGQPF